MKKFFDAVTVALKPCILFVFIGLLYSLITKKYIDFSSILIGLFVIFTLGLLIYMLVTKKENSWYCILNFFSRDGY